MKSLTSMKVGLVCLVCLTLSLSCSDKVTMRTDTEEFLFTINGLLVKDMNLSKDIAYFTILRDSELFDSAVVKVGSDTLTNQGGGIYHEEAPKLFDFGQSIPITVFSASDNFSLNTSVLVPGSFEITSMSRDSVTSASTDDVAMRFSLAAGASGYFQSVVRPDGSNGASELIEAAHIGNTLVPRDAFYDVTYVIGIYKVYLVAYRFSFLEYPEMLFYLPDGLPADNLQVAEGTICAGVVAPAATIKAR